MSKKHTAKNKRILRKLFILIMTLILASFLGLVAIIFFTGIFKISNINVQGNDHYTKEEIIKMIEPIGFPDNSIMYYLKNKYFSNKDIPLIQAIEVKMKNSHELNVEVYEKSIIGCIESMGSYMYFDKDGFVVDSLNDRLKYIPIVIGVNVSNIVLDKKLPIDDKALFLKILEITQAIQKRKVDIDKVYIDKIGNIIFTYKDVRILIGKGELIEEQVAQLSNILPEIIQKGELDMRNYNPVTGNVPFRPEEKVKEVTSTSIDMSTEAAIEGITDTSIR